MGRAGRLCPGTSDVDLLRNGQSVVNLNAEIPNGTLDPVAQKQLNGTEISGPAVDERCRAYCRVDMAMPEPRRLAKRSCPGFLPAALI